MPQISKVCLYCGCGFSVPQHRDKTAKFCCKTCHGVWVSENKSTFMDCEVCGKNYRRANSHMCFDKKTCSLKCRGIAFRTESPTSKDYPAVKKWMKRRDMIKSCNRCNYKEVPDILVVHHIDRDRTNNDLNNLEILCPNCHAIEHYSENKKGWGHASSKRK